MNTQKPLEHTTNTSFIANTKNTNIRIEIAIDNNNFYSKYIKLLSQVCVFLVIF